ncbi:MAG: tetratricopeptide repeat protein [Terriglobales bacterium]
MRRGLRSLVLIVALGAVLRPLGAGALPRRVQLPSRFQTATTQELEKQGDELRLQKVYAEAIEHYRAALTKPNTKPGAAVLHNKIGIALLQLGAYKDADKSFKRAVKLDHVYAEAYNNLGAAYYLQRKYGKAIKEYVRALRLREQDATFHNNLGTALFMQRKFPEAQQEFMRALELNPNVFDTTSSTGVAAQLSTSEDRAQFNYLLARMYAQIGDFDRSIHHLRKAMEEGYPQINNVYKDTEFAGLRKDPRFTALMATPPAAVQ